jgi:NADH-quinone oxidoreductase subunit C
MTPKDICDRIAAKFADRTGVLLELKPEGVLDPFIKVAPAAVPEVARFLRDEPELAFDYLMCLSGMDYGKGTLGAVYHLASVAKRHKITIKVEVPAAVPEIPTVSAVWPTANWHEREAYDLIGIRFTAHPDLRRILLPDDWEGHPLRKDYTVPEFYQGIKVPS